MAAMNGLLNAMTTQPSTHTIKLETGPCMLISQHLSPELRLQTEPGSTQQIQQSHRLSPLGLRSDCQTSLSIEDIRKERYQR